MMFNRFSSSRMRRVAVALGLAMLFVWLSGGATIYPAEAQARSINLTGSIAAPQAGPWYIAPPPLGNDANDCIAPATPCATIGAAIGKAAAGDTINIAAGTYAENVTVTVPLNFVGAGTGSTIVDGNHTNRVFNITSGAVSIIDLTVQNGSTTGDGGGIYSANALTLTNVDVLSNTAASLNGGGGVYAGGVAVITGGIYQNNLATAGNGGGLRAQATLTLSGTTFISNTAQRWGGGLIAYQAATVNGGRFERNVAVNGGGGIEAERGLTVNGTQFTQNTAYEGGGLYHYGADWSQATLINLLLVCNTATSERGNALYGYDGSANLRHGTIVSATQGSGSALYGDRNAWMVYNNIIDGYTVGYEQTGDEPGSSWLYEYRTLFANVNTPYVGTNWMSPDPNSFSGTPGFVDPLGGDYHLTASSEAINRAQEMYDGPFVDFDNNPRPAGCGYDIGAYEYQSASACMLTVGVVGTGVVTPTAGIHPYAYNEVVTLTASPVEPYGFSGWSGDVSGASNSAVVYMNRDHAVTATFGLSACHATSDNGLTVESSPNAAALQQAADTAPNGGTVKVAGTCAGVMSEYGYYTQTLYLDKDLTVLGGYTITNWTTSYPLTQPTVLDAQHAGRVIFADEGALTLTDLTVQNGYAEYEGGGIYAYDPLTLNNVAVISNTAGHNGGGIKSSYQLLMSNVLIANNVSGLTSYSYGGGLYAEDDVEMFDTRIISNMAKGDSEYSGFGGGAAIFGLTTLVNSRFEGNLAENTAAPQGGGYGGGLYAHSLNLSDTVFLSNTAIFGGGAFAGSEAWLDGGLFEGNTASGAGGGLYMDSDLTLTGTHFISNTAYNGGGLYGSGQYNLTLADATFARNQSIHMGGGLYLQDSSAVLTNVSFDTNMAHTGAGLQNSAESLTLTQVTFTDNHATHSGGGLYNGYSDPTLINVLFSGNQATNDGGGMYTYGGMPVLTHVLFVANTANQGGGLLNSNGGATLTDVTFSRNQAYAGGGMYNFSSSNVTLTNVIFEGNLTPAYGGYGGGMYNQAYSNPTLINVLFSGNQARYYGGGMDNYNSCNPTLINVTFGGNWAGLSGGGLYNYQNSNPTLVNSILWGNVSPSGADLFNDASNPIITYSNIGGGYTGTGNLNVDPLYSAPITATGAPTTTGDYRLQATSPVIDAGNNLSVTIASDLAGQARQVDISTVPDTGNGTPPIVDLGAYEVQVYDLNISLAGQGEGTVILDPPGSAYASGAVVTLTATPSVSSTFVGFSGDIVTPTPYITVTMDADKDITATFALKTFSITPTVGSGGSLTPATPQTVNYGASATFTITPNTGYHIADVGVDGISQGPISLYTFDNITTHHTITATFAINTYTLTVNYAGKGVGSVISNPSGPDCIAGTVVTLTAVPSTTSRFTGWSGDVISTTNPLVLTMDSDKAITATFVTYRVYLPLILR